MASAFQSSGAAIVSCGSDRRSMFSTASCTGTVPVREPLGASSRSKAAACNPGTASDPERISMKIRMDWSTGWIEASARCDGSRAEDKSTAPAVIGNGRRTRGTSRVVSRVAGLSDIFRSVEIHRSGEQLVGRDGHAGEVRQRQHRVRRGIQFCPQRKICRSVFRQVKCQRIGDRFDVRWNRDIDGRQCGGAGKSV